MTSNTINISRPQLIIIGVLLLTLLALAIAGGMAPETVPYDPDASHDRGLLALKLWLQEMGYQTEATRRSTFVVPDHSGLFFSFPGQEPFSLEEAEALYNWVAAGGSLVLVGPAPTDTDLASNFGISLPLSRGLPGQIRQLQPILPDVPSAWSLYTTGPFLNLESARSGSYLRQPTAIPALGIDDDRVTAAIERVGRGHVWFLSPAHDLSNQSLRDEQQAWLLPALLRTVPDAGTITFDAYHILGPTRTTQPEVDSLRTWFYTTPLGWSVLASICVLFIYLLSQGARLGPPVETDRSHQPRTPAEHVSALAILQQRANQRDAVARYHRQRLITYLITHFQVPPDFSEADLAAHMSQSPLPVRHSPDHITRLLNDLRRPADDVALRPLHDRQLVKLVSEVDEVIGAGVQHSKESGLSADRRIA